MSVSVQSAIRALESTKLKDRTDALAALRRTFESRAGAQNFNNLGTNKFSPWASLFEGLFCCIRIERNQKSGLAAAEKRLEDAAKVVLLVVQCGLPYFSSKAAKALIPGALTAMKDRSADALCPKVAPSLLSAIHTFVQVQRHVDHLRRDHWIDIVERAFNVVLGYDLATGLTDPVNDSPTSEEDEYGDATPTRKRGRGADTKRATPQLRTFTSVSDNQSKCMDILIAIFRSPTANMHLLKFDEDYGQPLAPAIIGRLTVVLEVYPPSASLYWKYIQLLLSFLPHVSLNCTEALVKFASTSWRRLIALWATKDNHTKEGLVSVLHILFPYFTASLRENEKSNTVDEWIDNAQRSWDDMQRSGLNKWTPLSLSALRLDFTSIASPELDHGDADAFVAGAFRAGHNFTRAQALTWTVLRFQADCASKLYELRDTVASYGHRPNKRLRLDQLDPVNALLHSLTKEAAVPAPTRIYELQLLLFIIDYHWTVLHAELQEKVVAALSGIILSNLADSNILTWTCLCIASVAHADSRSSVLPRGITPTGSEQMAAMWDSIWANIVRRANLSSVCRAACHAARALLLHIDSHSTRFPSPPLSNPRVLADIENLAKDLDVQGPTYPYDSVCLFLAHCLQVTSKDMRLYRMQLEDKVLTWFLECWKLTRTDGNILPAHTTRDILYLLETVCAFTRRSDVVCSIILPRCDVVEIVEQEHRISIVRDYILDVVLPESITAKNSPDTTEHASYSSEQPLVEPGHRQRRLSISMLQTLEAMVETWSNIAKEANPSVISVRRALDMAVVALAFQSLLIYNGIRCEKLVVQTASKAIALLISLVKQRSWSYAEQMLVLSALEPTISTGERPSDNVPFVDLVSPEVSSGIRADIMNNVTLEGRHSFRRRRTSRMDFQRVLWRSFEDQYLQEINCTMKDIVRTLCSSDLSADGAVVDDGWGSIRTGETTTGQSTQGSEYTACAMSVADTCMSVLTKVPLVQSASGMPTRDKELFDMVITSDEETFISLCYPLFEQFRTNSLHINFDSMNKICEILDRLARKYHFNQGEAYHLAIMLFFDSAFEAWCKLPKPPESGISLLRGLCESAKDGKLKGWRVRDAVLRLCSRFLVEDPHLSGWPDASREEDWDDISPGDIVNLMNKDLDTRIRFRAATCSARLFSSAQSRREDSGELYLKLREFLCNDLNEYEPMMTRTLCLANVMVISSGARRGSYWNLIEILLQDSPYQDAYERSASVVLDRASKKLGLDNLVALFENHAAQVAYALLYQKSGVDQFPPHVLGFADRKEFAQATFRAFTPVNLTSNEAPLIAVGRQLFKGHCNMLSIDEDDGIALCFGEIVGYRMLSRETKDFDATLVDLLSVTRLNAEDFPDMIRGRLDVASACVVSALSDYDISPTGGICHDLDVNDPSTKKRRVFEDLVRLRKPEKFMTHEPHHPRAGALEILQTFDWLDRFLADGEVNALTYHVLQHVFAAMERTVLVNEQIRILNGLCIWIATRHESFNDSTILHVLFRGAISLLHQPDLARGAQSILAWAFARYRADGHSDSRFPDHLIRICRLSSDYASSANSDLRSLGEDLGQWIDAETIAISKMEKQAHQVLLALPTWSRPLVGELQELYATISTIGLCQTLASPSVSANKFHIVGHLRDHALAGDYSHVDSSASDFWRLKACIPPGDRLLREDVDAFAGLLMWNKGFIDGFASNLHVEKPREGDETRKKKKQKDMGPLPLHLPILNVLLSLITENDFGRRDCAYQTLRTLVGFTGDLENYLDRGLKDEVLFLKIFSPPLVVHAPRDIEELLSSDVFTSTTSNFPAWICAIAQLFSEILAQSDAFYAQLLVIVKKDPSFCKQIIPFLVSVLLQPKTVDEVRAYIPHKRHSSTLSRYFSQVLASDNVDVACVRSIVDIILHLRTLGSTKEGVDPLCHDKWLKVDYILLARSAITCAAYTTALLFLELAVEYDKESQADATAVEQVLYDIYGNIDEPDGFYGIKPTNLTHFLLNRFHHEGQWDKAFRFHGAALEAGDTSPQQVNGLMKSLHAFGFNSLASVTAQGSLAQAGHSDMTYSLGWRTDTWDIPDRYSEDSSEASLYFSLRSLHVERDQSSTDATLQRYLFREMQRLRALGSENIKQIREVIRNILCLHQLSQSSLDSFPALLSAKDTDITRWAGFSQVEPGFEFGIAESIIATRLSMVHSAQKREDRHTIGRLSTPFSATMRVLERQSLLFLSALARSEEQGQIALNSIIRAEGLERPTPFEVSAEFANVLWSQSEEKRAVELLKQLRNGTKASKSTLAAINARLGTWTAEACLEKPSVIWHDFFSPAIALTSAAGHEMDNDRSAAVYHACAIFAEAQYYAIAKSPETLRLKVYIERRKQELARRPKEKAVDQVLQRDEGLFQQSVTELGTFLRSAIDMYARSLEFSDDYDNEASIRLCSLWLANFDNDRIESTVAAAAFSRVPSRKLVFLAHQLCARMSTKETNNQKCLMALIQRMCAEHPFHSLYQVYCLRQSKIPLHQAQGDASSRRSLAATNVFERLNQVPQHRERVADVEALCEAALQWAVFPIKGKNAYGHLGTHFPVPASQGLKILNLSGGESITSTDRRKSKSKRHIRVPVMTVHTPIDRTMEYKDCAWFERFDTSFSTAGGINLPKIIKCYDHTGKTHRQLFKGEGNDDLRQDAVMEQVFELVNTVLARDRRTKRRDLKVRDYKVIPLSPGAGVLEFVDNTTPMRNWLIDAHRRYTPSNTTKLGVVMSAAADLGKTHKENFVLQQNYEKLTADYHKILKACPPVMRHYFTEVHKQPMAWFKMRLNYTRSVATTSIVGHILGLGDRHTSNILMDNSTGELVHIDLGIAFDQGKNLRIVERVPFRMTSNIVDGMGIAGTDGVFQRCAEETLRVLREGRGVIMTILEVFRHDPLHSWTTNDWRAAKAQPEREEDIQQFMRHHQIDITINSAKSEEAADRALSGVSQKLDPSLSVAATVSGLVAEAKDPENLSKMFPGWMSHI